MSEDLLRYRVSCENVRMMDVRYLTDVERYIRECLAQGLRITVYDRDTGKVLVDRQVLEFIEVSVA